MIFGLSTSILAVPVEVFWVVYLSGIAVLACYFLFCIIRIFTINTLLILSQVSPFIHFS